jgi:L-ascorbate metabolism protein UlaG (beta-lactamase superfamily)
MSGPKKLKTAGISAKIRPMVITYLGEGTFRLQSGETSLLVDPSGSRLKADVTVRTAVDPKDIVSDPGVVAFAGEYEIKGIEIEGIEVKEESASNLVKTAFKVTWEDITIAILGSVSSAPSGDVLEKMGEADVLIVPVEEDHFLEPAAAATLTRQLEPAVVIPSLYSEKSLKAFAKELGQNVSAEDRFTFKKKDLTPEAMKLVILAPKA